MPRHAWILLGVLVAGPTASAYPLALDDPALDAAVAWVAQRTRDDGCIAAQIDGACGHASTRDAVLALSAVGRDPNAWGPPGASPVDWLRRNRGDLENESTGCGACIWAETVVVLAAAGRDPRTFGDYDYVAKLDEFFDGVQVGSVAQINDDAWALMAYAASDEPNASKIDALRLHLETRQNSFDGGWAWNLAPSSDPWGTATVILALVETGTPPDDAALQRALEFLHGQQADSGLVEQDDAPSAESTAITAQAAHQLGEDPDGPAWAPTGTSLVAALLGLQNPDGSFAHNELGGSTFLATTQALPALRGVPYPYTHTHTLTMCRV